MAVPPGPAALTAANPPPFLAGHGASFETSSRYPSLPAALAPPHRKKKRARNRRSGRGVGVGGGIQQEGLFFFNSWSCRGLNSIVQIRAGAGALCPGSLRLQERRGSAEPHACTHARAPRRSPAPRRVAHLRGSRACAFVCGRSLAVIACTGTSRSSTSVSICVSALPTSGAPSAAPSPWPPMPPPTGEEVPADKVPRGGNRRTTT
ncbi:uncharacterized protein ACOB8E_014634 [Sarcophilus harrisii]